ncbi:MAG: flippase [Nanoarchaeota archaeon]
MTTYTKKVIHGAGLVFIMSISAALVSYLTRMILARSLSPSEYGLFYAVFTFVLFFLFFRDLGMGNALAKYIPEFQIKKRYDAIKTAIASAIIIQLLTTFILCLFFFLSADFLSKNYFKSPEAALILKILIFYAIGSIFFRTWKSIFQGFQNMKMYSLFEFLKNSMFLIFVLLFLKLNLGFYAPALSYSVLTYLIALGLLPVLLRTFPYFKYKVKNFRPITKKIWLFALPVFLTSIGGRLISCIDTLILTYFGTLEEVGIYNVILPSTMIFLYFGNSISATIFPMVSELWAKKDKKRLFGGLKLMHRYSFVIIIPAALTAISFSQLFIKFFFGKEYLGNQIIIFGNSFFTGSLSLQILMIGMLFFVVAGINHNIISAVGKPGIVTKIILFSALINFVANIILIPRFSIVGAAFATSLSYLTALFISTHKLTGIIKVGFPVSIWMKLVFAGIVFVLAINYTKNLFNLNPWVELIVSSVLAGIIYIIVIYLLRIIDIKEIKHYISLAI